MITKVIINPNGILPELGYFFKKSWQAPLQYLRSKTARAGVVTGYTIHYNDPIHTAPGNLAMAMMIHELVHVAQYEAVGRKFMLQTIGNSYAYDWSELETKRFRDFNREQQCKIAEDYYTMLYWQMRPPQFRLFGPRIAELRRGEF